MISGLKSREVRLVVGGEARVELLPPEVAARIKSTSTRRAMVGFVVVSSVLAGAGFSGASMIAADSAAELEAAQAQTSALIAQQGQYAEVGRVENSLRVADAARLIATSTEIDWQSYLADIAATLPENVTITTVNVDGATPLVAYTQPTGPLQGSRVGSITFSATSESVPRVAEWLDGLTAVRGFAGATPSAISLDEAGYSVSIAMYFNSDAFANRFVTTSDAESTVEQGANGE